MRSIILGLLLALSGVTSADAGWGRRSHSSGYSTGWHTFHGYWYWWNGYAWSAPHTYVNGVYSLYTVPARTKDWKERLVEAAKDQDDHRAYLEALGALGYKSGASASAYSYSGQGDTVYGTSTYSLAELYGKTDLNVLYEQATRLAQSAQDVGASATTGHQSLVKEAGTASARVAEILARGEVAAKMLQATEPSPSARIETRTEHGGGSVVALGGQPILSMYCSKCHLNTEKHKGGFSLDNLTPEWLDRARDEVLEGRMPKDAKDLHPSIRIKIAAALKAPKKDEPKQ